uniref:BTB domain-containing protein n=1 Tax=Panagrellus redivivus TaxID=6233 RepID=A0A7E4VV60_PANRE
MFKAVHRLWHTCWNGPSNSNFSMTFSAMFMQMGLTSFWIRWNNQEDLFVECCDFFTDNQNDIVATEKFKTLSPPTVTRLLKKTFDLETQFDVIRHAHANGMDFILDPLEQPIIESLSLDTFCNTVSYVWACSRDDLKDACAKFFNDNQAEIRMRKEFYELSPHVTHGVMKLGYEILSNLTVS